MPIGKASIYTGFSALLKQSLHLFQEYYALGDYNQAILLKPTDEQVQLNRAMAYHYFEDFENAYFDVQKHSLSAKSKVDK